MKGHTAYSSCPVLGPGSLEVPRRLALGSQSSAWERGAESLPEGWMLVLYGAAPCTSGSGPLLGVVWTSAGGRYAGRLDLCSRPEGPAAS